MSHPACTFRGMDSDRASKGLPIVIPRLDQPGEATCEERDEHLMLLEAARQTLEVEWTETLAAADASGDHHLMGYPSTVAYLKDRLKMAGGRAHRYLRNARAALRFPATFSAWRHRQVSGDEAELLFRSSERVPDQYPTAEGTLLELVGDGVDDTRRTLEYWQAGVDRPGAMIDLETQLQRRRCEIARRPNGMVSGEFALPQLEGESLLTALDALMPPPGPEDSRSIVQRRADALGDLARSFLDGGRGQAQLNVHVDLPTLQGQAGHLHETADGAVLDPLLVDQLVCDCSVSRVVFGPHGEVLDVGRRTRVVPAGLRRAVIARDRHCVAPGCSRTASWCDVHHIVPWEDAGVTEIHNLCLLCRYHHTLAHLGLVTFDHLPWRQPVAVGERST